MEGGGPIRNIRTDIADGDPNLIYPGNPASASDVYDYLHLDRAIQLSFIVLKSGRILLYESSTPMTRVLQMRQAFGE